MRTSIALAVLLLLAGPSQARMVYPEWMAGFDLAYSACRDGAPAAAQTKKACRDRDRYWAMLRDAGFTLRRDETNPNGYVWDPR